MARVGRGLAAIRSTAVAKPEMGGVKGVEMFVRKAVVLFAGVATILGLAVYFLLAGNMAAQRVLEGAGWTFWRRFASSVTLNRDTMLNGVLGILTKLRTPDVCRSVIGNTVACRGLRHLSCSTGAAGSPWSPSTLPP